MIRNIVGRAPDTPLRQPYDSTTDNTDHKEDNATHKADTTTANGPITNSSSTTTGATTTTNNNNTNNHDDGKRTDNADTNGNATADVNTNTHHGDDNNTADAADDDTNNSPSTQLKLHNDNGNAIANTNNVINNTIVNVTNISRNKFMSSQQIQTSLTQSLMLRDLPSMYKVLLEIFKFFANISEEPPVQRDPNQLHSRKRFFFGYHRMDRYRIWNRRMEKSVHDRKSQSPSVVVSERFTEDARG